VDETGSGIKRIRPKSLYDMLKAAGHCIPEDEEHEAMPPTSSQPMPAVGRRPMLSRP
jgi:hypothetical protein